MFAFIGLLIVVGLLAWRGIESLADMELPVLGISPAIVCTAWCKLRASFWRSLTLPAPPTPVQLANRDKAAKAATAAARRGNRAARKR